MLSNRAERFETFVVWYLRFNGYFTVPNFVVHAGDDCTRLCGDVVGNRTEVDTIAIRLPYSHEESGTRFPTDRNLLEGAQGRFDVILAEVKSGKTDSPNKIWRNGEVTHIQYLLKFLGWHVNEDMISHAARVLSRHYVFEEANFRVRFVIFADRINTNWSQKGRCVNSSV
jgi:hypothetical protein